MIPTTAEDFENLIKQLEDGKINSTHKVDGSYGKVSLLVAALTCFTPEFHGDVKKKIIERFLKLGCDVDSVESSNTPLEIACMGGKYQGSYSPIVKMMLEYHTKGDLSDLNVMKAAAKSINWEMFDLVITSNKVDVNATRMKGSHILHYLASESSFSIQIESILSKFPDLTHNPVDRKGFSPFAIAINAANTQAVNVLKKYDDTKIIGKIENPKFIIAYELVDRYEGDFWKEFPDMMQYAISIGKEYLLPSLITDIFVF